MTHPFETTTLSDGSVLLIAADPDFPDIPDSPSVPPLPDGTLSTVQAATDFITDAVTAGITFDVLKAAVRSLYDRHRRADAPPPAQADTIRDAVLGYLLRSAYTDVDLTEVRRIDGQGWYCQATADGHHVTAMADESGTLIHVKLT